MASEASAYEENRRDDPRWPQAVSPKTLSIELKDQRKTRSRSAVREAGGRFLNSTHRILTEDTGKATSFNSR